jgi:hypothetical protein
MTQRLLSFLPRLSVNSPKQLMARLQIRALETPEPFFGFGKLCIFVFHFAASGQRNGDSDECLDHNDKFSKAFLWC